MNSKMITSVDCTIIRFNKNILPKFFVYYSQLNYYFNMIMNNVFNNDASKKHNLLSKDKK